MSSTSKAKGHFTLLYFASASSYTGKASQTFEAPSSVALLFNRLEKDYPGVKAKVLNSCALTINLEYVDLDESLETVMISEGDEVAIIPPVSSG